MTKKIDLPLWLKELLPAVKQPQLIDYSPETKLFSIVQPTGEKVSYTTLEETYHANHETSKDSKFTEAFIAHVGSHPSIPIEGSTSVYMFMERNDEDRYERLISAYEYFLEVESEYLADTENFTKAWSYINHHPAFWLNSDIENSPWYWNCSSGVSLIEQYVYFEEKTQSPVVLLDTGGRNPNGNKEIKAHSTRYADWRLEVTEDTYEKAFISLAARVNHAFNSDGTSKPIEDFPYPTPEWVTDLEERLKENKSLDIDL